MIDGLKPYPKYNETALPWLGRIPAHWDLRRIKTIAIINPSKSEAEQNRRQNVSVIFLPMERVGTDGRLDCREKRPAAEVWNGLTYFRRGDVIIAKITPCFENGKGACLESLPTQIGFGSTEFHVLRPRSRISAQFLYLATTEPKFRKLGADNMTGTAGQKRVPTEFVKNCPIALPPRKEQDAIVRFLDHVNRRVERYIQAKRKLIALLNEQKQTIIHRAVTTGIDPTVPLKPSCNPWLGKIPKHWEERRAKYFYREVDDRSLAGAEELLSVSHITGVTPRSQKNITMFMAASYIGHKTCEPGDIVINTMWAWMGALGVAGRRGIVSPSYGVYRPLCSDAFVPEFIDCLLRTKPFVDGYRCRSTGIRSSRLRLYPEQFLDIPLIRPSYAEQERITAFVAANTRQLDNLMEEAAREIALLHEYRTRLIADVVTGQLDVREAAARLPEEAQEPELLYADSDDAESIEAEAEPIEAEA
jgi:type I restriction enzyme, S subunit